MTPQKQIICRLRLNNLTFVILNCIAMQKLTSTSLSRVDSGPIQSTYVTARRAHLNPTMIALQCYISLFCP